MCTVSNIGDDWQKRWPQNPVNPFGPQPSQIPQQVFVGSNITREEFDTLKREVKALKKLLEAGKKYDETTGQPDCHMDDKVALIKKIAGLVGVDVSKIFDPTPNSNEGGL